MAEQEIGDGTFKPIHTVVDMPDGSRGDFVGKSREDIEATWNRALHKTIAKQWILSTGIAIVVLALFSYLLQLLYRALLFVIYGTYKNVATVQNTVGQSILNNSSITPTAGYAPQAVDPLDEF